MKETNRNGNYKKWKNTGNEKKHRKWKKAQEMEKTQEMKKITGNGTQTIGNEKKTQEMQPKKNS